MLHGLGIASNVAHMTIHWGSTNPSYVEAERVEAAPEKALQDRLEERVAHGAQGEV